MHGHADKTSPVRIRTYLIILALAWTALVGIFIGIELTQLRRVAVELARAEANTSYEKDVLFRRWVASHGGVYVPVTDKTPPNPYLSKTPERDLTTPSGRRLTLVNPAYMTRQVYEIQNEASGIAGGHITSLKPIRPENAADPWEVSALQSFEKGMQEFYSVVVVDDKPYLRFMRPLLTEKGCLKCHAAQGYKEGEVRGGISILHPLETLLAVKDRKIRETSLLYGGIWLIGLCGLGFGAFTLNRRILERRRVEENLRESEEKFRLLVEGAPEAIFVQVDQCFAYLNPAAVRLFGAQTAEDLLGRPIMERFHPDYHEIVRERIRLLNEERKAVRVMEQKYLKLDGSVVDVEVSAVPVTYQNSNGSLSFARDVAERKRTEREMSVLAEIGRVISSTLDIDEVYERFAAETRKLIPFERLSVNIDNLQSETIPIAYVFGTDIPGRRPGDSFLRKGSISETLRRTLTGLIIQPENVEEIFQRYPRLASVLGKEMRSLMSVPLVSRNEMIGSLNFRSKKPQAYAERDLRLAERIGAQIAGAIANAQLFNERDKAERSLRQSERRLREAQSVAHLGNWTWHIKTNQREWSEEMYRIFGLDKNGFTGDLSKVLLEAVHPEDLEIVEQANISVIRDKKPSSLEHRVIWPDRSVHHVWVEPGELTLDEHGNPDLLTGICLDITERKRMEEERLQLEKRLHRSEKMEALGQLAGGVAHDLNNVLGVLVGYSELLLMEVPPEGPLRRHVNNILQSGQRGAAIIQDLLTLTRRGVAVSEVVNLNRIVLDYFRSPEFEGLKAYHPDVAFKTDLGKDLMSIQGSPVHLEKTIMNLVSNAAEAIIGKGQVTLRLENRHLDRPVRGYDEIREGDYVVLMVSDTGKGISPADIKRIFEPFYTKKTMGRSGTGLGLAVVWGTVQDHNGYIDVQSEEGKGSTFILYFPATRREASGEGEPKPVSIEAYRGHDESILVVDDVKEQRELATAMLTRLGYRVISVSSGEEALVYLKTNKPDLIVLDMIMEPGMDGLETYRRILEIIPKQRAVIVSGFSETDRVRKAQDLGAGTYVKKPYVLEKIGLAIRDELRRCEPLFPEAQAAGGEEKASC